MAALRRFVIPDIHGCAETFRSLLYEVIRLKPGDALYILGDMIDRGPGSKAVIDEIIRLLERGFDITTLRGNHEEMLLNSCRDRDSFYLWLTNGGHATLASFAIEDTCDLPDLYRDFLASLPLFWQLDDFVLVHACLNFLVDDPFSDNAVMLWSRHCKVDRQKIGGRRLVCGHTPQPLETILASIGTDRIMLDNGCVYGRQGGLGRLSAFELNTLTLFYRENIDM
jgi:serine/threonine protein phosphatase 1